MSGKSQIPPDDALLCERCGYDLAGLIREDACSECGRGVVESLPRERSGRDGGGLFASWSLAIASPVRGWDRVGIGNFARSWRTLMLTLVVVSLVPGLTLWVVSIGRSSLVSDLLIFFASFPVFFVLTMVEELGIRFFGRRRGWRISKYVSTSVVAHASIAWSLSGVGVGVVWGLYAFGHLRVWNVYGPISSYVLFIFLAFLPGLLWFETLVWIGMRKLRYANIPGSERHLADAELHGLEARATGQVGDGDEGSSVADSADRS